jgi:hypothetical protein
MRRRSCSVKREEIVNCCSKTLGTNYSFGPSGPGPSARRARPHVVIACDSVAAEAIAKVRDSTDTRECVPGPIHNGAPNPPVHPRQQLTRNAASQAQATRRKRIVRQTSSQAALETRQRKRHHRRRGSRNPGSVQHLPPIPRGYRLRFERRRDPDRGCAPLLDRIECSA